MKINKDFAVKVEDRVFTENEISSVSFDIAWFKMDCVSENGTKFTVEASLKDVEFLSNTPVYGLQVEEEFRCNVFGDKSRRWVVYESDKNNAESEITVEGVKQAVREYMEQMGELEPKTATEMLQRDEWIIRRFMPCFKDENMEPKSPEEEFKKAFNEAVEEMTASMKNAGEQIKKGLESMKKATEPMKVNLSIDSEQFSKLIKKYNQDITRSGG